VKRTVTPTALTECVRLLWMKIPWIVKTKTKDIAGTVYSTLNERKLLYVSQHFLHE